MYDMLPFPNIDGKNIEEQTFQINNYLMQFKETLEFILSNISFDNLSQDVIAQLEALGSNIQKNEQDKEEQLSQISNKVITVPDVINSNAFKLALEGAGPKNYLVSVEQVQSSEEPEGINIYAIEDESGEIKEFKVKNGSTPKVEFSINFDTGNLEYTTS